MEREAHTYTHTHSRQSHIDREMPTREHARGSRICILVLFFFLLHRLKDDIIPYPQKTLLLCTKRYGYLAHDETEGAEGGVTTGSRLKWFLSTIYERATTSPVLLSCYAGIIIALVPSLHEALFGSGSFRFIGSGVEILGQAAVPTVTVVISATFGKSLLRLKERRENKSADGELPPTKVLLMLVFVRLVVVGGLQFIATAYYIIPHFFPDCNVYMKLALLIECASPSANMCVVVCQQLGNVRASEALSTAYVAMYLAMLATLVGYVTIAINMIGYADADPAASAIAQ